jgi:hypothetical protein
MTYDRMVSEIGTFAADKPVEQIFSGGPADG